jgi:hypothetical protein
LIQIEQLGEDLLDFSSLSSLEAWLSHHVDHSNSDDSQ